MKTLLQNDFISAEIKSIGAELISLKNKDNVEFIWEGNPQFWGKHSPVLFPIVGGLKKDTYHYNGKQYHLSRHGFARDMEFNVVEKTNTRAVFSIQSNESTLLKYPFEFEFQIIYTLEANHLHIGYKVCNHNEEVMPFSVGAHPAFALPKKFENYTLKFNQNEILHYHLLENNLIAPTTQELALNNDNGVKLSYALFENDALVFKTIQSKTLSILDADKAIVRVHYADFPNLGIWTVANAPFLCIEPWCGYADTVDASGNLLDKEGIIPLEPNQTFEAKFSIEVI
ncbi:aldose 1-epimerase family protein [Flavobacterium sp. UMI-01]|uniref:aldose 1-epimerase family protein n=1 Tax=Flavobacterium sp. UMI-01 TaxID=1441053 RepID=UPI001C7D9E89|nr:aldose 1-epimerase family protein [Flavobacterium sp. UMI-01]GIZ08196.1 aldose 1-epimerase [Flavobacterium sp. UMI-01]